MKKLQSIKYVALCIALMSASSNYGTIRPGDMRKVGKVIAQIYLWLFSKTVPAVLVNGK